MPGPVVYLIDASDRIVAVNEAWDEFARANSGAHLVQPGILGRPLWSLMSDLTTEEIYRALVSRVRQGVSMRFGFRCDAPDRRRLLQMAMSAELDGVVRFEVSSLATQDRSAIPLLRASAVRGGEVMRICGWCKRIPDSDDVWLEAEDAIRSMNLFEMGQLPELSHGICPTCYASMIALLDEPALGATGPVRLGGELP
jgi:hypothetical protein